MSIGTNQLAQNGMKLGDFADQNFMAIMQDLQITLLY